MMKSEMPFVKTEFSAPALRRLLPSVFLTAAIFSTQVIAHEGDDPVLAKVMIDQFEWRAADEADLYVLEADAWIGKDLHKFWLKTDIEYHEGMIEEAELQALYSRAISPYWDLQIGLRSDLEPTPTRNWGVLGIHGLAPYFFEIDSALFIGDSGAVAARFTAEYELMLTQRWALSPEVSATVYGQTNDQTMNGSGLSNVTAGLRLRYEIRREFAPYVGVHWSKKYGATADFAQAANEQVSDAQLVAGIHAWF